MILGIGTDIVEIKRIKEAVQKWGGRFLNRIYTEKEVSYCYQRKDPFAHLAGRFAAKEAVIKAFSGVGRNDIPYVLRDFSANNNPLTFKEIEICNDDYGSPYLILDIQKFNTEKMKALLHLTISHEKNYAVATVIIELRDS